MRSFTLGLLIYIFAILLSAACIAFAFGYSPKVFGGLALACVPIVAVLVLSARKPNS